MARNRLANLARITLGSLILTGGAWADGLNPGSLLVFLEFQNQLNGQRTVITFTNTYTGQENAYVHYIFVNGDPDEVPGPFGGSELLYCNDLADFTVELAPSESYSFLTIPGGIPDAERGFLYAYTSVSLFNTNPVSYNYIVGNEMVIDGVNAYQYSLNAVPFRAAANIPFQGDTDDDGDDVRDLNGVEYEPAPDRILIPRFDAQVSQADVDADPNDMISSVVQDQLIMLGLSGARWATTLDFLIYNDNENVFSRSFTFNCWAKVPLSEISAAFDNEWLMTFSGGDPMEPAGADYDPVVDRGWMHIDGRIANSDFFSIDDPAFLAALVEYRRDAANIGTDKAAADLPFVIGTQLNGDLIPQGNFADGCPGGSSQPCGSDQP